MIKVINQNVEVWAQEGYTLDAIWKHIARCARVCYQSTPKYTGEDDYSFLVRTLFRGDEPKDINTKDLVKYHLSVCEHATVHLKYPLIVSQAAARVSRFIHNPYSRVRECDGCIYVTTNMRVLIEHHWMNELEFIDTTPNCLHYNERTTINFTTDIGTSRELNRHRCHSVSEESTRYCRYNADKFGNNITVAKLPWIDYKNDESEETNYENGFFSDNEVYDEEENTILGHLTDGWSAIDWFLYGLQISNLIYNKCVQLGWAAQQAREILPLNTKTQVVHTAFVKDWQHFIDLRSNGVSGVPHPMIKELADKVDDLINATTCG